MKFGARGVPIRIAGFHRYHRALEMPLQASVDWPATTHEWNREYAAMRTPEVPRRKALILLVISRPTSRHEECARWLKTYTPAFQLFVAYGRHWGATGEFQTAG